MGELRVWALFCFVCFLLKKPETVTHISDPQVGWNGAAVAS